MNLLYIGRYRCVENEKKYLILPYGDNYWKRYLDVFDQVTVLAENPPNANKVDLNKYTQINNNAVKIKILKKIENPIMKMRYGIQIRKELTKYISESDAVIIKMLSNKGIEAIKIAIKLNKPFMIEMTGDVKGSLSSHGSILRKIYAPILYNKGKKILYEAPFGMYVSQEYLQNLYPIKGKTCGVSDVFIPKTPNSVLENRIKCISDKNNSQFNIGLIGNYMNNIKGIDTAIKALKIMRIKPTLHVLGHGDSNYWENIAKSEGVYEQIVFPDVLKSTEEVLKWIDSMDLVILPSRTEGLPRCIIEAMSRGCPCITSNVGGLPELIDYKWIHKPNDYKELARLIELMLGSEEHMKNQAQVNFKRSKLYSIEEINKKRNEFLMKFRAYCENKE